MSGDQAHCPYALVPNVFYRIGGVTLPLLVTQHFACSLPSPLDHTSDFHQISVTSDSRIHPPFLNAPAPSVDST